MKKTLPLLVFLAASILAGCSKVGNEPTPSLTGTWTWSASTRVTTPKNGQPSTAVTASTKAYSEVHSFDGNGVFTIVTGGNTEERGTYTYSGSTLTVSTTFYRVPRSVSELGAHRLVWTTESEDATNRYTLTETLTR
jgi:hypothetical protein